MSRSRPRTADRRAERAGRARDPGRDVRAPALARCRREYPQFMRGGRGARVWDADGNEYVDLMCSYGPVVLGHQHPKVEAAAARQAATGDCMNAPGPVMVDLAELLVATVRHADWAILAKNGTDATTMCCTIARAQTGRSKILVAAAPTTAPRRGARPGRPAYDRRPRQPRPLHLQRPGQRAAGRRRGRRRPGRDPGQPVQARRRLRPGAGRPRLRPRAPRPCATKRAPR